METRKPVFSGSWYPSDADACEREIMSFLNAADPKNPGKKFVGGIVPHAGWFFSGAIACRVIQLLIEKTPPDIIAVFGMHLHENAGARIMAEGAWETPFGDLQIASHLAREITRRFSFSIETAQNFIRDNTIELQLPFIKYFFKDAKILPIGMPPNTDAVKIAGAVATHAAHLGLNLKVIGSTDLTHYGMNYGFTPKGIGPSALNWVRADNDGKMIAALHDMDPFKIIAEAKENQNACCAGAAAGAVETAKQLGAAKAETVSYATSYDKSPGDSFVGYVGIVFGT